MPLSQGVPIVVTTAPPAGTGATVDGGRPSQPLHRGAGVCRCGGLVLSDQVASAAPAAPSAEATCASRSPRPTAAPSGCAACPS
jgi:hypothetical protein